MAQKPKKPKTRDRILQTSLALFNEEGESQVSTVEIAGVLDISPGNLYYHFKGKEAIIEALFDNFEEEIRQVLSAPIKHPLAIDENWIFVYIVFEEINDFRFFYNNLTGILDRCPGLRSRFARLLRLKQDTANAILKSLEQAEFLTFGSGERDALAARIAAHLTFWLQFSMLEESNRTSRQIINDGVYSVMMQIAPFAGAQRGDYAAMLQDFFARQK